MADYAIRHAILTLLGQPGRARLAREMGMPDPRTFEFAAQSEQDQCQVLLDEWKRRDSRASIKSVMRYAVATGGDEEDDGE